MKSSKTYDPSVTCPFCSRQVKSRQLAEHAKKFHVDRSKDIVQTRSDAVTPVEGTEVPGPTLIQGIRNYVVDESGFLVNPKLLEEEHHRDRNERLTGVVLPQRQPKQPQFRKKKAPNPIPPAVVPHEPPASERKKSTDDAYRAKEKWLQEVISLEKLSKKIEGANSGHDDGFTTCPICKVAVKSANLSKHLTKVHSAGPQKENLAGHGWRKSQKTALDAYGKSDLANRNRYSTEHTEDPDYSDPANLVKCPFCKHRTQYNVLYVHLQVSHPEVNPKIVMSKFNRTHRNSDPSRKQSYEDDLNDLVREYERLKQGQDEPRDGGKYLGHMRRERGKFGSLPLYDDYSDEADAQ
jgi:hypothetical protein